MKKKILEVGKIVSTQGLKGEVRVENWCDSSEIFAKIKVVFLNLEGTIEKEIEKVRFKGCLAIVKFKGIDSIDDSEKLIGQVLFAKREDIKISEDRFFIQDLIGVEVVDYENLNVKYGLISDVLQYGASDIYVVRDSFGIERLFPVIDDVVVERNLEKNVVYVKPMKGLLDV